FVRVQAGNRTDHEFLGGDPVTGPEGVPVGTFRQQVLVHGVEGQGDPLGVHTTFEDTLPHGFGQGDDRVRLTCQRGLSFQGEAVPLTATAVVGSFTGQPALLQESTQLVHHGDTQGPSHVECDGGVLVATCCVQNGGPQPLGQGGDAPDGVVDACLPCGVVVARGDAVVGDACHLAEWCGVLVLGCGVAGEGHRVRIQSGSALSGEDALGAYRLPGSGDRQGVGHQVQDPAGNRGGGAERGWW